MERWDKWAEPSQPWVRVLPVIQVMDRSKSKPVTPSFRGSGRMLAEEHNAAKRSDHGRLNLRDPDDQRSCHNLHKKVNLLLAAIRRHT